MRARRDRPGRCLDEEQRRRQEREEEGRQRRERWERLGRKAQGMEDGEEHKEV